MLPTRPTFALSLDPLLPGDKTRVSMPQTAAAGSFSPILPVDTLGGFANAILGSAMGWQDQMLGVMPGQRERIVHVRLSPDEGGLNLSMPPSRSITLMQYGDLAGKVIRAKFDFGEHRWRRTLVVYEQLQRNVDAIGPVWPGFSHWFSTYTPQSYKRVTAADRKAIHDRIGDIASLSATWKPPVKTDGKFPRPSGRLRIVPDV
jgi:hypothetical protein